MPDNDASLKGNAAYVAGLWTAVLGVVAGIFMHWVAAAMGPGIGLFGIDAWTGAFVGLALVVMGLWWWRSGVDQTSKTARRVGKIGAVILFSATVLGANHLLAASWSVTCSDENPEICYHLGALAAANGDLQRAGDAFALACDADHLDGCARLPELDPDQVMVDDACRNAADICETISADSPRWNQCQQLASTHCSYLEVLVEE